MKDVLFIHGAYHAGWCWGEVVEKLSNEKFSCHLIDLPGQGSNSVRDITSVTIQDYVDCVVEYIEKRELKDLQIVSHSLAGVTLSKVVERVPEKINRAYFLTAAILNNQCFLDLLPEKVQKSYRSIAHSRSDNCLPPNKEVMRKVLFNETENPEPILDKLESQPIVPYQEIVELNGFQNSIVDMTYIRCTKDISLPPEAFNEIISFLPQHAIITEIEADHEAMFSNPQAVADVLLRQT